jgi:DNA repair protein SbcC/Rad50
MRLHALRLQNFRQHADTTVTFDGGLTGIIGANGSGKSTILESIAWALYGNAAARGTRDSIRWLRAGGRAAVKVELEFSLGGHRYRVVRGLTSAELFLDGGESPIANSLTGVTELLQKRLGMTRDEFFHTYFTGQKELDVMAALTPSERGQFLSRVLGYERLRVAQGLVRERRKAIGNEVAGLRTAMRDPAILDAEAQMAGARAAAAGAAVALASARATTAAAEVAARAPEHVAVAARRDRHLAREAERRALAAEEQTLASLSERTDRDAAEVEAAKRELELVRAELVPLPAVLQEWQTMEALARDDGRRRALQESERELAAELARLNERRDRLATAPALEDEVTLQLEAARRTLETAQQDALAERSAWDRDRQEAETKRLALRQQYLEYTEQRERFVQLGADGICPTCARPLGDSYRAVLDQLDGQLETVELDGKYFRARVEQLQAEPDALRQKDEQRKQALAALAALERKLAKIQAAVVELRTVSLDVAAKQLRHAQVAAEVAELPAGYEPVRHAALKARVESLTALDSRAARLGAQADREGAVSRERQQLAARRDDVRGRQAAVTAREAEDPFDPAEFDAATRAIDGARDAERSAALALATAQGEADASRESLARIEGERAAQAEARARLDVLQDERRHLDELDRYFTDLRTDLNAQLRPELSEVASAFLGELTDGRYAELELDDQYALVVLEDGVPKPVISGGEEDLANLVLRLAVSQMIAERSGQPFSLLVLDEVFGSLDDVRREHVVSLLRRLHDRFEQVIVITHIEDVREGLDRVLEVRFDPETGKSSVVDTTGDPSLPAEAA